MHSPAKALLKLMLIASCRIGYVSIETRSLPASGTRRQPPDRRPILIAIKCLLFQGQETRLESSNRPRARNQSLLIMVLPVRAYFRRVVSAHWPDFFTSFRSFCNGAILLKKVSQVRHSVLNPLVTGVSSVLSPSFGSRNKLPKRRLKPGKN